ncbi:MAG: hypothetical protein U0L66_00210, partial [Acutalibacteraceae bacterium]|nr:hypothetical protein [Acutalibacteraceae bacterium]
KNGVSKTIPQSRYARQPPLHKGALLSANQRPPQTPICPPKVKQARQKQENKAFAELVIVSINPSFRKLFFDRPYFI